MDMCQWQQTRTNESNLAQLKAACALNNIVKSKTNKQKEDDNESTSANVLQMDQHEKERSC